MPASADRPEMLRQLQALRLVVGAEISAVERGRARAHALVDETPDDLAVLQDEGHFMAAHFEDRAAARPARRRMAESGVEEAGIMDAELADQRVERRHLRR